MPIKDSEAIELLRKEFGLNEIMQWMNKKQQSTLRDEFAMSALQGICSHHDTWGLGLKDISMKCYIIADDMIVERTK